MSGFIGYKRLLAEIDRFERLETENMIIIDVNSLAPFSNKKVPPRFNNTTIAQSLDVVSGYRFQARILPQSEPYCRASFLIEIKLPPEYPFKAPDIIFLDPIYHPSVQSSGEVCYCKKCVFDFYKPTTMLREVIEHLIHTIDNSPDRHQIRNDECFIEYQNDYQTFYNKALEFTLSYGRPRN